MTNSSSSPTQPVEHRFFLSSNNADIFCTTYSPPTRQGENTPNRAVLFINPFFESAELIHRFFVYTARQLANKGFFTMRFDFFGQGESDGDFSDATFDTWSQNGIDALNHIYSLGIDHVTLLGFDMGANFSLYLASRISRSVDMLLVNPVTDPESRMQQTLRINLTAQMLKYGKVIYNRDNLISMLENGNTVNIDGYNLNHEIFKFLSSLSIVDQKYFDSIARCDVVLMSDSSSSKDANILKSLVDRIAESGKTATYSNITDRIFWNDNRYFVSNHTNLLPMLIQILL